MVNENGRKAQPKKSANKAMKIKLRAAWQNWINNEVKEGRNRNEAETMAIVFALCKIFDMTPQQFGIWFWPHSTKPLGTTMITGRILANMVMALMCDRIDNPPTKSEAVNEYLQSLNKEMDSPKEPAMAEGHTS